MAGKGLLIQRLIQLYAGLIAFGFSLALMVRARLGLGPWDVLHQGIARAAGLRIGVVTIATGAVVMLLWIPLRQRPGFGTLSNVIVIGLVVDASLALMSAPHAIGLRVSFLAGGILLNGIATGLYIGAGMGSGPRDGLMTGLAKRGHSIAVVRTFIEIVVLATGFALGGTVGLGTLAFALLIGPLAQFFLPRLQRHGASAR